MMKILSNIKHTTIHRVCISALLLVLGIGHISAVVYSPYKGKSIQRTGGINSTAEAARGAAIPISSFQSTSTLSGGTRSDAATPLINTDGSVAGSAYMGSISAPTGPLKGSPSGTGTPTDDLDPNNQQPLGDALIPLLLLASAYAVYKVARRRVREQLAGQ